MYKREQKTKFISPSVNLFSLLDDTDETDKTDNTSNIILNDTVKGQQSMSKKTETKKINDQQKYTRQKTYNSKPRNADNIEDDMFKQYYDKKSYKHEYKNKIVEQDGFKQVHKKKDFHKETIECKFKNIESNLLDLDMDNYYKVLVHHNNDQNWNFGSYHNVCVIKKWIDIPKLFNTLINISEINKFTDFDTFIMKNDISPLWEDIENRNGCICSVKIDSLNSAYEILKSLMIHTVNNTLMEFSLESWDNVNGLSFSPKKIESSESEPSYCVIVKIWFKHNYGNNANIDKYFNPDIQNLLSKYSVKVKAIRPEY